MITIQRKDLIEDAKDLPIERITIDQVYPELQKTIQRRNDVLVILLDDKDKLNNGISSKVLRSKEYPSENVVITPEGYEKIRKNAEASVMRQVKRVLALHGVRHSVIDEYCRKCSEQQTWNPK